MSEFIKRTMRKRSLVLVPVIMLAVIPVLPVSVSADDFTQTHGNTSINWTSEVITTASTAKIRINREGQPLNVDTGVPTSLNRARQAAYRHSLKNAMEEMASSIQHIMVDPGTSMGTLLRRETHTQLQLAELIQQRSKSRIFPSGFSTAKCELSIPMGELLYAIPYTFPDRDFPNIWGDTVPTEYTGLIIDARGLGLQPMLLPSLYDETGREIFGREYIHSPTAVDRGTVAYCYDEDEAMRHAKSGGRPFFTVALRAMRGCPVIASNDAAKVYSSPDTRNNLKNCNIVIIIEKEEKSR